MNEFFNPKSMITPGAAGGLAMLVANTLWVQFGITQPLTAAVVSALFSIVVVMNFNTHWMQRGCLFLLNGVVIFCMATGATNVVAGAQTGAGDSESTFFGFGLASKAAAASDDKVKELCGDDPERLDERTRELCEIAREQQEKLNERSRESTEIQPTPEKRKFFDPWFSQSN